MNGALPAVQHQKIDFILIYSFFGFKSFFDESLFILKQQIFIKTLDNI